MAEPSSPIASLLANPRRPALDEALLARAEAALPRRGARRVLSEGVALEWPVSGEPAAIEAALREAVADAPVDVVVRPAGKRSKRLFLADMDSTMIEQECIDELADLVGLKPEVAAITERAMRGEIAFEPALRERVALLRGLPVEVVDRIMAERITFTPGGATLLATLRANGCYCCLVSGGFTLFTSLVGRALGFDEDRANRLVLDGDRFGGTVAEPILGREAKRDTLEELRARLGLDRDDVLAVGDGANDLAMLGEAGLGVAFRAKPAVAAAAHARIDHADLTALLYLQGYAETDLVHP